ncbi:MAG: 50S ribosomal protein L22 [Actinomycetota bacterium]|jgi:large subunit ribosomal protein L22|nr:50S ribosomal protein L22 [Actinomycetota bacterium]
MKTHAKAQYVRQSPYKVRRVLDIVRGLPVSEARVVLVHTNRRAADPVLKCLDSAVANAEHNMALDADELFIAEAYADEGPTLKRWRPRARGRATRIRKRTSHITIVVADEEEDA